MHRRKTINTKISVRINEQIIETEIRLIDEIGNMLGVISPKQALIIAQQKGFDLVEISPGAIPPVCKIMNYGKYKYEQQKKLHEARKKQKIIEVKEIKIRSNIADGDYSVKLRNCKKFIEEGNKIKVSLTFKGRELMHQEVGYALMNRFRDDAESFSKAESGPKMEGKNILMVLVPK